MLKGIYLAAARLLQRGKLKPEEAACRLRFLGIQLTLGELAEPFSRDRFTELFLESEKWRRNGSGPTGRQHRELNPWKGGLPLRWLAWFFVAQCPPKMQAHGSSCFELVGITTCSLGFDELCV